MTQAEVTIRPALNGDRAVVEGLWSELLAEENAIDERFKPAEDALDRWRADYPEWLRDTAHFLLLAERVSDVVGFVSARLSGPAPVFEPASEVFIEYLFVSQEFRRNGVGRLLVGEVIARAAELGATRARLRSLARSDAANEFWRACGGDPYSIELVLPLHEAQRPPVREPIGFRGNSP